MADTLEVAAFRLDVGRLWTHFILLLITAGICLGLLSVRAEGVAVHSLTIVLGYLSLIYMVITLAVGPLKLLRRRRNPVNINLRRDIGIWAAITGCLHVVLGFQLHMGGNILLYFFRQTDAGGYAPQLNLFGLSNYVGLIATLLLLALLLLSNDISLRKLRGPRWKLVQRSNYVLFGLSVLHMVGYQSVLAREPVIRDFSYVVVLAALLVQALGIALYRVHESRRLETANKRLL
jgi:methionine sulfoxide reductase heme-binding subunit